MENDGKSRDFSLNLPTGNKIQNGRERRSYYRLPVSLVWFLGYGGDFVVRVGFCLSCEADDGPRVASSSVGERERERERD